MKGFFKKCLPIDFHTSSVFFKHFETIIAAEVILKHGKGLEKMRMLGLGVGECDISI